MKGSRNVYVPTHEEKVVLPESVVNLINCSYVCDMSSLCN
jgi:hypothetical protein